MRRSPRLLVVDGDRSALYSIMRLLTGLDLMVSSATDLEGARSATDGVGDEAAAYSVIIIDLQLPDATVSESLRWLRSLHFERPDGQLHGPAVLVYCAATELGTLVGDGSEGRWAWLPKPVDEVVLRERLGNLGVIASGGDRSSVTGTGGG